MYQAVNPFLSVSYAPVLGRRAHGNVECSFGYIDPYADLLLTHIDLLVLGPTLHDSGLVSPGNCSGSIPVGV